MSAGKGSKTIVITGAASGFGLEFARLGASRGYNIVMADVEQGALDAASAEIAATGVQVLAQRVDVSKHEQIEALAEATKARFGAPHWVFNNAGVNAPAVPLDELPLDKWFSVINTNVTGVFLCARAAFGLMRRQSPQGGRIINNGSISAHTPRPFTAPYTASKHAVTGLTKALALDGRAFNIVASQIDIGNALTELSERMTRGVLQANGSVAPEPMMDARHVADAVRHIAAMPLHANVLNMTVMASAMPFVGRG